MYSETKKGNLNLENVQQATALNLLAELPMWHDRLQYHKVRQAAISLQQCSPSTKGLRNGNLVKKWYTKMQKAARIIQRAWRAVMRRRNENVSPARECAKDLKSFYEMVKSRHVSRGLCAPSFELFANSVKHIQAATEGARVRRRLKSRRLQTIILEIKEIRMLLFQMSQEANCDSTPYLFPQLCTQLQQKIMQLRTALNGQQMDARFLLRRGPATPLVLYPSRSTSRKPPGIQPIHKSGDQTLIKLSSGPSEGRMFYIQPSMKQSLAVSENKMAHSQPSTRLSKVLAEKKIARNHSSVTLTQGPKGKVIQLGSSSPDLPECTDSPDSAKLLPWYFLAQQSPSKHTGGHGTPTDFNSAGVKVEETENLDSASSSLQIKSVPNLTSPKASPKAIDRDLTTNKNFDEQPLPQRRKMNDMSFEETAVGGSAAGMYLMEYAPTADLSEKPKRPFLKRKSVVMPSQKLDWSKVKPMVSSRLEPELKTKLSCSKGTTKETIKTSSKTKKANYSQVKSRLFSYEEILSPRASGDGTGFHADTREDGDTDYPPLQRGLTKGLSVQGAENGKYARALGNRQRTGTPDSVHLECRPEEARESELALKCAQTSILETQSVATYSSRFNSARYLHKLGNSEHASRVSLLGSCQQQNHKIRLRILPRSKENEIGSLFVQESKLKEEMQELWEDQSQSVNEKTKRLQNHSHRYASYQGSPQRAVEALRRPDETTRPSSPQDSRRATDSFARKEKGDALYRYLESK